MKKSDIIQSFDDPEKAKKFAQQLVEGYMSPSFGSLSLSEADHLVFAALVSVGCIDPKAQSSEIARDLRVAPIKARNLLCQWQLRSLTDDEALKDELVAALRTARFDAPPPAHRPHQEL
jgi:hypothetical protein